MMKPELRLGRWQDVLSDIECGACIFDGPYSAKTHAGHDAGAAVGDRRDLSYASLTPDDVRAFVAHWAPRTLGWMVSLTDDVLFPVWRDAMRDAGRMVFQDIPAIVSGMTVRLAGDGPSSWAIHLAVSRPRTREFASWGTLPGGYSGPSEPQIVVGGKPLWLMRAVVRDYSRPGMLVCDPFSGGATTLLAAAIEGRRAVGAEMDSQTHAKGVERLSRGYTPTLFSDPDRAVQAVLNV